MSRQQLQRRLARLEAPQQANRPNTAVVFFTHDQSMDEVTAAWYAEHPGFDGVLFVMPEKEKGPPI